MNTRRQQRTEIQAPFRLTRDERAWLEAVADAEGLTLADTMRRLIRLEAERRGLKDGLTR